MRLRVRGPPADRRGGPRDRRPGRPGRPRPARGSPSHSRALHDAAASTSTAGMPASCRSSISSAARPCADAAARVGADVDRDARLVRGGNHLREAVAQGEHVVGVPGELGPGLLGDPAEGPDVDHRGHQRGAAPGHLVDQVERTARCRARRSRRRPGPSCATPSSENVCTAARAPAACAASTAAAMVAAIPGGRQVTDGPVDPVADQLDPAGAGLGLRGHGRRRPRPAVDLDADVAQIAPRRRDVPAGPRQARHAGLVVQLRIRVRRTGVPHRQHAGVPVDVRPAPGLVEALRWAWRRTRSRGGSARRPARAGRTRRR